MPEDAEHLDLLLDWTENEATRNRILASNPAGSCMATRPDCRKDPAPPPSTGGGSVANSDLHRAPGSRLGLTVRA